MTSGIGLYCDCGAKLIFYDGQLIRCSMCGKKPKLTYDKKVKAYRFEGVEVAS